MTRTPGGPYIVIFQLIQYTQYLGFSIFEKPLNMNLQVQIFNVMAPLFDYLPLLSTLRLPTPFMFSVLRISIFVKLFTDLKALAYESLSPDLQFDGPVAQLYLIFGCDADVLK